MKKTNSISNKSFSQRSRSVLQNAIIMFVCAMTSFLCACTDEGDDIESIWSDKKLKITGCVYNGVQVNGNNAKEFYTHPYFLEMSNGRTFKCVLNAGSVILGTWNADGKSKEIVFKITQNEGVGNTPLSRQAFEILKNARYYSGDSNVMKIHKDDGNFLMLTSNFDWSNG